MRNTVECLLHVHITNVDVMILARLPALLSIMQSTHLLLLSAAALLRNHPLEFDPVSVPGFTPQPNHWFIQPEPAWLSSLPGIIVKRTITALCVPVTATADSSEDLDQSAIRIQSVGRFLINCLDHFLLWILCLIPRLRSGSWKLTAVLLLFDPEILNKPFYLSLCVWLNLGSLSLVVIVDR
ncbi:hypothetical protein ILYODFUR_032799, partial [Ilyodon furcidens]